MAFSPADRAPHPVGSLDRRRFRRESPRSPVLSEARTLDPHSAAEAGSTDVTHNCYEALVAQAPRSAEIVPRLAKSWTVSPDAQQVTFQLQEDVTFVDGTPMDAEAVKKSFERCIQINAGPAAPLAIVDSIETPDPLTVRFNLSQRNRAARRLPLAS